MITDWSGVLGYTGMSGEVGEVAGKPGGIVTGDQLGLSRIINLNMRFTRMGPSQTLVEPTESEQLVANTDDFLSLLRVPDQLIELDMPDGTSRFTRFTALDPSSIVQPRETRTAGFTVISPYPYWREGGNENSQTVSGADTISVGGNADVYDAVLEFSGDGTFEHLGEGWSIEVVGSSGAVTVDLGARTVTEGGVAATNRIRRDRRDWGWFVPGSNSVTSDVSVDVTWRNGYE